MENQVQAKPSVKQNLIASYRQFFALETPALTMPLAQRQLFIAQSLKRHYRIAVFFTTDDTTLVATVARQLGPDRYLLKAYRSNLYRVVTTAQLAYIKRV